MSSLLASIIVVGLLIIFGVPMLYWIFFKMDEKPQRENNETEAAELLSENDIQNIQTELNVLLPTEYIELLAQERPDHINTSSLLDHARAIIEATKSYRRGFAGLPPWPAEYIYIGDEADACPYVLNIKTGTIKRLDKGNIENEPLQTFITVADYVSHFQRNISSP